MDLWNLILFYLLQWYIFGVVGFSVCVLDFEFRRLWVWKQGIIVEFDLSFVKRFKSEIFFVRYSLKFSIILRVLNGQVLVLQNNEEFILVYFDLEDVVV